MHIGLAGVGAQDQDEYSNSAGRRVYDRMPAPLSGHYPPSQSGLTCVRYRLHDRRSATDQPLQRQIDHRSRVERQHLRHDQPA